METKVWSLKGFLIVTAILEGSTGLALMSAHSFVVNLLLGSSLSDPMSIIISRVAGVALVSLALACWILRKSESQNGLGISLLFYNIASIVVLAYAGFYEHQQAKAQFFATVRIPKNTTFYLLGC